MIRPSKEEREYWHDLTMKLMAGALEIIYARADFPEEGKIYITLAKPEEGTDDTNGRI